MLPTDITVKLRSSYLDIAVAPPTSSHNVWRDCFFYFFLIKYNERLYVKTGIDGVLKHTSVPKNCHHKSLLTVKKTKSDTAGLPDWVHYSWLAL